MPLRRDPTSDPRKDRYHHGDLRAALIEAAVDLIVAQGIAGFSLAEASRRVGVAGSAPYRHFADREALLDAVAIHGAEQLARRLAEAEAGAGTPEAVLARLARAYVRFADTDRPLLEAILRVSRDKERRPAVLAAHHPIVAAFEREAAKLVGPGPEAFTLAKAVMAVAHGHAALLRDGGFASAADAEERVARSVLALIDGRARLFAAGGEGSLP